MPNRKTKDVKNDIKNGEDRAANAPDPESESAAEAAADDRTEAAAPNEGAEAIEEAAEPAEVDPLEAAQAEIAQLKDQLLRALAEVENVRRRAQRDREDASKFAATAFARDLLPVADNLRRALESIPAEALQSDEMLKTLAEGVEMTERQLLSAFERHHIRKIEPRGEKFDSHLHQAMFEVPGSGQPAGTVVELLQPGYLLHDRLLRPAMVGVAKAEPAGNGQSGDGQAGGDQTGSGQGGNGGDGNEPPPPGHRVDTTA